MGGLIKNIIERIKLWWINLFKKKKKLSKKKTPQIKQKDSLKKQKYILNVNLTDDNKKSSIGTFYPQLSEKNKLLLKKKVSKIKKRVADLELDENKKNIKLVDDVLEIINDNDIYLNQAVEINDLLNRFNKDDKLNLNTNEKISILKDEISTIIDQKLTDYETNIVKKAYREYDNVNYVIVTTLLIDDIIDDINELNDNFYKNKYTLIEYKRKVEQIKDRIDRLQTINQRKEVQDEIENLRKDFYTKKKDKYDLLYNEEIFINLNNKCDELLETIQKKEYEEKSVKIIREKTRKEKNQEQQKKQEEIKKKKKEQDELEKEYNENILKRFIDMEFARKLLLLREKNRKELATREDIIREILNSYTDFIIGETNEFHFERNKVKTEVTKLYNDITSTICAIQKKQFIPLEHINVKLEDLTIETLERQSILNDMIEKNLNYKMEETETSKNTTSKLNTILSKEKEKTSKENKDQKVLKKEYKTNSPQ